MVQSLLCVLAQLLHRDQQGTLDCLAAQRLTDGRSALEAAMQKWCGPRLLACDARTGGLPACGPCRSGREGVGP